MKRLSQIAQSVIASCFHAIARKRIAAEVAGTSIDSRVSQGLSGKPTPLRSLPKAKTIRDWTFTETNSMSDNVSRGSWHSAATATVCVAARMIEETHVLRGAVFLVVGAGMLGLTAVAQLSDSGARSIIVADPNEKRLTTAREFGATHCVCSDQQNEIRSAVSSASEGRGADIALDFAGVTSAVQTCLASVRVGGCVLLAGSVFPSDEIRMTPETIVRRMLTIRGLHNYLPSDLDNALGFLQRVGERFQFSRLVARSFQLTDADLAFEYAQKHRPVRVAVKPPSR